MAAGRGLFHLFIVALCTLLVPAAGNEVLEACFQQHEEEPQQGLSLLQQKHQEKLGRECVTFGRACWPWVAEQKCCKDLFCDGLLCASPEGEGVRVEDVTADMRPEGLRVQAHWVADKIINEKAGLPFNKEGSQEFILSSRWPEKGQQGIVLAALKGDEVKTGMGFYPFDEERSKGVCIDWFGSKPEGPPGGGVALFRYMIKWALDRGFTWIGLSPTLSAEDFYRKRGLESVPMTDMGTIKMAWLERLEANYGKALAEDVLNQVMTSGIFEPMVRVLIPPKWA